jgi:hypothetical protein
VTRVGITGHRQLDDPAAWLWVADAMKAELAGVKPPLVGITSLAVGADQVLARVVLELGGEIYAVLPFAGIERSFSAEELQAYRDLVNRATVEILDVPGTDSDAYLAAGQRVVALSDLLLAVWDGMEAKGRGGTADIVALAVRHRVPLIHMNPISRTIERIIYQDDSGSS